MVQQHIDRHTYKRANIIYYMTCVAGVSCGPPRPLENGLFQGTDFHASSSVVYQCNAGFYLLGDNKVHCTNSGKWGGSPPACLGTSLNHIVVVFKLAIFEKPKKRTYSLCYVYIILCVCVC